MTTRKDAPDAPPSCFSGRLHYQTPIISPLRTSPCPLMARARNPNISHPLWLQPHHADRPRFQQRLATGPAVPEQETEDRLPALVGDSDPRLAGCLLLTVLRSGP